MDLNLGVFPMRLLSSEDIQPGNILLAPGSELVRYVRPDGTIIREELKFNPKACGLITNITGGEV